MMEGQYYYKDSEKKDQGPFSFDELKEKLNQGEISSDTFVINTSDMKWFKLGKVVGTVSLPACDEQAFSEGLSLTDKILIWNKKAALLLAKMTTFGKYEPSSTDELDAFLNKLLGIQALVIWVSSIVLGYKVLEDINALAGIVVGAVAGFILQFICYLFSSANIKLICGSRIVMSSMLIPNVLGIVFLLLTALTLLGALVAAFAGSKFDVDYGIAVYLLLGGIVSYTAALFSFKCKTFFVDEEKNASAGREAVSIMRYSIRLACLVSQIAATVTGPFVVLAALVSGDSIGMNIEDMAIYLAAIVLPIVNYFLFITGAFIPDLIDCVFRAGENNNNKKDNEI